MKKIKILYTGLTSCTGGIETYIYNLFKKLDKDKFEIYFLVMGDNIYKYNEMKKNAEFIFIPNRKKNFFKYIVTLKNIYKNNKFDYIHFHISKFSNFLTYLLAFKYSTAKIIIHSHQYRTKPIKNKITNLLDIIGRKILRHKSAYLVACSDLAYDYMFDGFDNAINNEKIIFNNGIDLKKFLYSEEIRKRIRKNYDIGQNTILYGHVGRFDEQKNHRFLIEIFFEICKIDKNAKLLLIGDGPKKQEIKELVIKFGIENKVIFMGNVDNVSECMSAMDKMIFPSLYEGLGLVLIEAQACNLPIYASKDVIPQSAKASELLEFIDLNSSAKEWAQLIVNTHIKKKNVHNELIRNNYDIDSCINYISKFYINNIGGKNE